RQLFQNLISNSLKYRSPERPLVVTVVSYRTDETLSVSVSDNGIGFESDQSEEIFGLLQRLHGRSAIPGHGMGLAIADKIVELHGGSISAESTPDEGSTFTVRFPLPEQDDGPADE
ncbi:MAG: ATP-binding protein, partial [Actinomycetota bacterium]|nr:ATP-binding protein [Actinomycetota bacterium]